MSKFKSWNCGKGRDEYFKDGKYYSDMSCKKELTLTEYETIKFWYVPTQLLSGEDIFNVIKPQLGAINFSGSHGTDMNRVENLVKYDELLNCILDDIIESDMSSRNRNEISAQALNKVTRRTLREALEKISEGVC